MPFVEIELENIITKVALLEIIVKDNIDIYKIKIKNDRDTTFTRLKYKIDQPIAVWLRGEGNVNDSILVMLYVLVTYTCNYLC